MENNQNDSNGKLGCLIIVVVIIVITILAVLQPIIFGTTTEYEKAGKEFGTWIKKDPSTWTETQREYYGNYADWISKQQRKKSGY